MFCLSVMESLMGTRSKSWTWQQSRVLSAVHGPHTLSPSLQYFDELAGVPTEDLPHYGGSVEIADYCPFSQEFSWHSSGEYQRSSDCRILENQPGQRCESMLHTWA